MKQLSRVIVAASATLALTLAAPYGAVAQAVVTQAKAGDLTVSDARMVYHKDHLDIFLTIKNASPYDEKLGGFDTPLANDGLVVVTEQDGKEVEAPDSAIVTAGKATEFAKGKTWLRIEGVKEPRDTDIIPVTLFFRRSPNAHLALALDAERAAKHPTTDTAAALPSDDVRKLSTMTVAAPVTPAAPQAPNAPSSPAAAAPPQQAPAHSWLDWFRK